MKLSDLISEFKRIEPDPQFSEHSKRAVLATVQAPFAVRERGITIFFRALEAGVALVLAGFFIIIATGGLSGTTLDPVHYAVIDPSGLQAEAQAIDIQIQLANLDYSVVTSTSAQSTTPEAATVAHALMIAGVGSASTSTASSTAEGGTGASSTASTSLSVDEALQALTH